MENIRLQKFLAESGVASRRKAEELIIQGKVKVNDKIVTELGTKVDPETDVIKFEDNIINNKNNHKKIYILLNKPIGVVTTAKDQFDRQTVIDLVKIKERLVPVGRLDMYTSGALILTNDGEFIYVTVVGEVSKEDIQKLKNGVEIDDGYITKEANAKILKIDKEKNISRIEITIHEGKNRQVRKMCQAIGKKVLALHRSKIGSIDVKDLKIGTWRYMTKDEINRIIK